MPDTFILVNPMNNFLLGNPNNKNTTVININISAVSVQPNECVICLDSCQTLIYNNKCQCKYYYHAACINKLPAPVKCVMCKKEWLLETNPTNDNNGYDGEAAPYAICTLILIIILIVLYSLWK